MDAWAGIGWQLVAQAAGTWLGSSSARCHCTCAASHDVQLLGLVKGQLERCGPENLNRPPPVEGHTFQALALLATVFFFFGVGFGALGLYALQHATAPRDAAAAGGFSVVVVLLG